MLRQMAHGTTHIWVAMGTHGGSNMQNVAPAARHVANSEGHRQWQGMGSCVCGQFGRPPPPHVPHLQLCRNSATRGARPHLSRLPWMRNFCTFGCIHDGRTDRGAVQMFWSRSSTIVRTPNWPSRHASVAPVGPSPTTATSASIHGVRKRGRKSRSKTVASDTDLPTRGPTCWHNVPLAAQTVVGAMWRLRLDPVRRVSGSKCDAAPAPTFCALTEDNVFRRQFLASQRYADFSKVAV